MSNRKDIFNRGTGVLVIEVRNSNPNGDPDAESEPRTFDHDNRGLISPVSFKRKVRDMVLDSDGPVFQQAKRILSLNGERGYDILEKRGRDRKAIEKMDAVTFTNTFWDGRVFGNTFLESMKDKGKKPDEIAHFISTGVVQFGPGVSVSPVEIVRTTNTNKSGVQEGKDRGMAPLAWRVVHHAVYTMPFFVNPMMASQNDCDETDIELLKFMIPHAYRNTASAIRPFVEVRHAWYAEHNSPLGSCPDSMILDALTPKRSDGNGEEASTSLSEYDIPHALPDEIGSRLQSFEDLCAKSWQ